MRLIQLEDEALGYSQSIWTGPGSPSLPRAALIPITRPQYLTTSSDDGTAEVDVCLSHPLTICINSVCLTSRLWGSVISAKRFEIFNSKETTGTK